MFFFSKLVISCNWKKTEHGTIKYPIEIALTFIRKLQKSLHIQLTNIYFVLMQSNGVRGQCLTKIKSMQHISAHSLQTKYYPKTKKELAKFKF
jgi:hypothetical protein